MNPPPEGTGHDNFSSSGSSKNQRNDRNRSIENLYFIHIHTYIMTPCKKKFTRFHFRSCNYSLQRIQFLQINAQYPSRLTNWILINKRFLDCLMSFLFVFIPHNISVFLHTKYFLVTNKV